VPPVASSFVIPSHADHVAVLVNPKAGSTAAQPRAEQLVNLLRKQGFKVEVFTNLDEAASHANQWHSQGCLRSLIGVGGDGTAAGLINRLDEGVPFCPFPAGNANLLAGYFHLDKDPEVFCRTIVEGVAARVDAGLANGRIFLLMASCGFDAEVVERLHRNRTGHIGPLTYAKPILQAIWTYEYPEIRVQWEDDAGESSSFSTRWLFAFNLPCYAAFRLAPEADGSDGLLDVLGWRKGHFWNGLWLAASVWMKRHHLSRDYSLRRAKKLQITSESPVRYQLDGDPGGLLPLDIQSLPGRLTLVIPKSEAMVKENTTTEE
jgi:diacylglycerol kinase (ATP)